MTVGITELPPEGMQLPGVALAGDADRGTKTTEGISLLFTVAGITVQGPQPQIERLLVWSALDSATCHEEIQLPDGRSAAILELTSGGQSIRFLLPTDTVSPGQAAYLDQALPAWLARYRGAPAPAPAAPAAAAAGPAAGPEVGVSLPATGPAAPPAPSKKNPGASRPSADPSAAACTSSSWVVSTRRSVTIPCHHCSYARRMGSRSGSWLALQQAGWSSRAAQRATCTSCTGCCKPCSHRQ